MIEVHNKPEEALCDGNQSLTPDEYKIIYDKIKKFDL
jgi:3-deoxy-7-phosphoheptulonate synthase